MNPWDLFACVLLVIMVFTLSAIAQAGCVDEDSDSFDNCTLGTNDSDANELDCDDSDPGIYPNATEDCDDGYDNNCDGLIDLMDPSCRSQYTPPRMQRSFNVTDAYCNELIKVFLTLYPDNGTYYAIEERVPDGWDLTDRGSFIIHDENPSEWNLYNEQAVVDDSSSNTFLRWSYFNETKPAPNVTYWYVLKASCINDVYSFEGVYQIEGLSQNESIQGRTQLQITDGIQQSVCGDGTCDSDESCSSCPEDCGSCDSGDDYSGGGSSGGSSSGGGGGLSVSKSRGTCYDGIQNQNETGIDCGGSCMPCPSCSDNIQNQKEEGIDCGGPCPACSSTTTSSSSTSTSTTTSTTTSSISSTVTVSSSSSTTSTTQKDIEKKNNYGFLIIVVLLASGLIFMYFLHGRPENDDFDRIKDEVGGKNDS